MSNDPSSSGKYKYLAKNTFLFAISSFASKVLTFLLVRLYTETLSESDYGIADLVITTSNLLVYIFTLEISSAVLRFAIERKTKQGEILGYGLKVVLIGTAALLVAVPITWKLSIFKLPDYFYIFLVLYFIGNSLNTILSNYLRAINDIIGCAISGIITTAVMLSGNLIALLVLKWGIIGYLASLVLSPLSGLVFMIVRVYKSKTFSFKDRCQRHVKREMLRYSTPLIFNGVGWWINNSLDRYFIIGILGSAANGIYAAAVKIPTIISVVQTIFMQAWNLSAIKEFDKEDKNGFFKNIYNTYNAGLVIVTSGLIILNIPLAYVMFAKEFFVAWRCSSILLLSALFSALGGFLGSIFTAVKNSKIFAYSTVTAAIINTVLNIILISWIGVEGAAIATVISFFVMWLIRLVCVKRIINLKVSIVRDAVAYALLCIQILLDHADSHFYCFQAAIVIALLLMYYKELTAVAKKVLARSRKIHCKNTE